MIEPKELYEKYKGQKKSNVYNLIDNALLTKSRVKRKTPPNKKDRNPHKGKIIKIEEIKVDEKEGTKKWKESSIFHFPQRRN